MSERSTVSVFGQPVQFEVSNVKGVAEHTEDTVNGRFDIYNMDVSRQAEELIVRMMFNGLFDYKNTVRVPTDILNSDDISETFRNSHIPEQTIRLINQNHTQSHVDFKVSMSVKTESHLVWRIDANRFMPKQKNKRYKMNMPTPNIEKPHKVLIHEVFFVDTITSQLLRVEIGSPLMVSVESFIMNHVQSLLNDAENHFSMDVLWWISGDNYGRQ